MTTLDVSVQNQDSFLDLLCAEEYSKRTARRFQLVRVLTALGAALLGLCAAVWPTIASFSALVGVVATALVFVIDRFERTAIVTAAAIKDGFDAQLFGIRPSVLAPAMPSHEEIVHRSKSVQHRRAALRDWYPDASEVPSGFGRLLCQRASVVWDYRLRIIEGRTLLGIAIVLGAVAIVASLVANLSLFDFIVKWIAPMSSLLVVLLQTGWRSLDAGRERRKILEVIERSWESAVNAGTDVPESQVRSIQDAIFRVRASAPVIPRSLQWKLDGKFWNEMSVASDRLKQQYLRSRPTP